MSLMDRLRRKEAWHDNDLTAWHAGHRRADGGVWAITPPCGYETWSLFAPGARRTSENTYADDPAAEYRAVGEAEDREGTRLVDHRAWMQRWVEDVSGGRVLEITEGWSEPYCGGAREYGVYARVAAR